MKKILLSVALVSVAGFSMMVGVQGAMAQTTSADADDATASAVLQELQAASAASQFAAEEARAEVAQQNEDNQTLDEMVADTISSDDDEDTQYYYTYDKSREGDFYGVELPKRLFNNIDRY